MNAQVQSAIRSLLKVIGGYFVARGIIANDDLEIVVSALLILGGALWSAYAHHVITKLHQAYVRYFEADSDYCDPAPTDPTTAPVGK